MSEAQVVVSVDQMWTFYLNGAVGTKEFRNWLAKVDTAFSEIRDADVDNEIDSLARQRRELNQAAEAREDSGGN